MTEQGLEAALRVEFAADGIDPPSMTLHERVMTIPDRGVPVRHGWLSVGRDRVASGPTGAALSAHGGAFVARSLAWLVLLAALLVAAAWTVSLVGQTPPPSVTFGSGSIASARGADLYVARPDGTGATRVATGNTDSNEIRELAFAPDRTAIAYVRVADAATGDVELVILDAAGRLLGTRRGAASPDPEAPIDTVFGWAPDSQRLAVYTGQNAREISLIGRDGHLLGTLALPDEEVMSPRLGVSGRLRVAYGKPGISWRTTATLPWSPDAAWISVPVWGSNGPPSCATKSFSEETCWLLAASDGTATLGLTDEGSNDLAWAPDGRVAVAHGWTGTVQIWPSLGDLPYTIVLPNGMQPLARDLAWSPDGSRLLVGAQAYGDDQSDGAQIYLIGEDREPVPLAMDHPIDGLMMVAWAPGGDRILFSTNTSSDTGPDIASIWSIAAVGGTATRLIDTTEAIFDVAGAAGD